MKVTWVSSSFWEKTSGKDKEKRSVIVGQEESSLEEDISC